MAYTYSILLGRITKVSGYEGAVAIKVEKIFTENIPLMESVFLEVDGRPVPFYISDSEYSGAEILKLKFEGYNSSESISEFVGCKVFLTTLLSEPGESSEIHIIVGFMVYDQSGRFLGKITDVIANRGQSLLSLSSGDNKEILIPFHDHFILSIDKRKKIVRMNIPEGLTEIN